MNKVKYLFLKLHLNDTLIIVSEIVVREGVSMDFKDIVKIILVVLAAIFIIKLLIEIVIGVVFFVLSIGVILGGLFIAWRILKKYI